MDNDKIVVGMICYKVDDNHNVLDVEVTEDNIDEISNNWNVTYFYSFKDANRLRSALIRNSNHLYICK